MGIATKFVIYQDDTYYSSWSFCLFDDDEQEIFASKRYKTKAAACSVATRMLLR